MAQRLHKENLKQKLFHHESLPKTYNSSLCTTARGNLATLLAASLGIMRYHTTRKMYKSRITLKLVPFLALWNL
ncbi:hypothetical protein HNY73_004403 [Argiope bruennichi]|uniref:Uncharacterized protein n=1 Tax=Argiope bruennichi TaxID=94029 RepID=A0A8T0FNV2_ARGBR|nr:hypothetical protein HNY73_004403 [Argiope bruennichi]